MFALLAMSRGGVRHITTVVLGGESGSAGILPAGFRFPSPLVRVKQINFHAEGLVSPSPLVGEGRGEGEAGQSVRSFCRRYLQAEAPSP